MLHLLEGMFFTFKTLRFFFFFPSISLFPLMFHLRGGRDEDFCLRLGISKYKKKNGIDRMKPKVQDSFLNVGRTTTVIRVSHPQFYLGERKTRGEKNENKELNEKLGEKDEKRIRGK